jgi:perosamine synthetase
VAAWAQPAPWLFCITVDQKEYGRSRDELMALLEEQGIETRPFFIGLHQLPPFREESQRRGEKLPITDSLGSSGMNLPTYASLTDGDMERIVRAIRNARR